MSQDPFDGWNLDALEKQLATLPMGHHQRPAIQAHIDRIRANRSHEVASDTLAAFNQRLGAVEQSNKELAISNEAIKLSNESIKISNADLVAAARVPEWKKLPFLVSVGSFVVAAWSLWVAYHPLPAPTKTDDHQATNPNYSAHAVDPQPTVSKQPSPAPFSPKAPIVPPVPAQTKGPSDTPNPRPSGGDKTKPAVVK